METGGRWRFVYLDRPLADYVILSWVLIAYLSAENG